MDPVRVFVGTDTSQILAVKVLEHSIKRHTQLPVEVIPMCDLPITKPKDPRQGQRTGFSFSRFCIPKLAGYRGRAIYMDADMLVFKDIRELWEMPFDGAKVIIQEDLNEYQSVGTAQKAVAPKKRIKQCAVMVLDCGRLDWDIEKIIRGLDTGEYDYASLMYDMCLLQESEIKYGVPFRWNSLEHFDSTTCLIHYTDMATQPWVSTDNKYGHVWFNEVRLMLNNGSLSRRDLESEIEKGYFRPSLIRDIDAPLPKFLQPLRRFHNHYTDKRSGYVMHKAVYQAKRERELAMRQA